MQNQYKNNLTIIRIETMERWLKSVKKRQLLYQAFTIKSFREFRKVLSLRTVSHERIR